MYGDFARVYDMFMEDTPYDEWVRLIEKAWHKHGLIAEINNKDAKCGKLILDLGCGSGNMTYRLAERGYDMIGIDNSQDMLAQAMLKPGKDIMYLHQDMRNFELFGTVDAVICICDGINYLLKSGELKKVFGLVFNYLNPGGIFIFDIITMYKYKNILGTNNFSEVNESAAFIWSNYFDKNAKINEYSLSIFLKNDTGLYERMDETHYQRAYSRRAIERLLVEAGLEILEVFDENGGAASSRSERIFFAARRKI